MLASAHERCTAQAMRSAPISIQKQRGITMTVNLEYMKEKYNDDLLKASILELASDPNLYKDKLHADRLRFYIEDQFDASLEELLATVGDVCPNNKSHASTSFFTFRNATLSKQLRDQGYLTSGYNITEDGKYYLEGLRHLVDEFCVDNSEVEVTPEPKVMTEVEVTVTEESQVDDQFDFIKLYIKLGILRLEDTDALLVRAMSNDITNEERDVLRKIYVGEIHA